MRYGLFTLIICVLCYATTYAITYTVNPEHLVGNCNLLKERETHYVADTTTQKMHRIASETKIGARLGIGLSNTNFNRGYPKPETKMDMVWKPSFSIGIVLRIPVSQKLSVQQEYLYTQLMGEVNGLNVTYKLKYISLPVLLMYEAIPKASFIIGPHFDLLVQAEENHDGNSSDLTHHIEERSLGGVIGLTYKVSEVFQIDGRYALGLNHINIRRGVLAKEFKTEMLQLSIFIFPFKRKLSFSEN